jgi:hypothetical protein
MFRRSSLPLLLGLCLGASHIIKASAQQNNGSDVVYEAARNKIGLLRYCREKALLDPATAATAIQVSENDLSLFASTRAPLAKQRGDQAEKEGRAGILGPNSKRDIATFAALFHTTPAGLCKEWADDNLRGVKGRSLRRDGALNATQPTAQSPVKQPATAIQSTSSAPNCP